MKQPINRIAREDVEHFASKVVEESNVLDDYQLIATTSSIYPGRGTPFGLMYAALGLAEAGEVQNKVKKAFRDDGIMTINETDRGRDGIAYRVVQRELSPERRAQIIKELGGTLWYIAAVCDEEITDDTENRSLRLSRWGEGGAGRPSPCMVSCRPSRLLVLDRISHC